MPDHPFSKTEQEAMGGLVGQIIPASKDYGQPGADDPEILRDILISGAPHRNNLRAALASLTGSTVDVEQALEFRENFKSEAELIQSLTIQCYYRDARVMRALDIEVRPPFPQGYVQEPNDFSILEPVRQRGEIYRKIP